MVLGMDDMDGFLGPSTNQKREIQDYIHKSWREWEYGANLAEIRKGLVRKAEEKASGMYMDYFPPEPQWIENGINNSFNKTDRKDYAFLGREGNLGAAIERHFFLPLLLDLFDLSKDTALPFYTRKTPNLVMSQVWPPSLDPSGNGQQDGKWDYESMLGQYHPEKNTITLFSRGIRRCSSTLSLKNMTLAFIVCLHEVSHWCSQYYPVCNHESSWEMRSYSQANDTIHETLAQWITYFCVKDKPNYLECFEMLNKHQSEKYQQYKEFIGVAPRTFIESIKNLRNSAVLCRCYETWRISLG